MIKVNGQQAGGVNSLEPVIEYNVVLHCDLASVQVARLGRSGHVYSLF